MKGEPDPRTVVDRPNTVAFRIAACLRCGRLMLNDKDFGWWIHLETAERDCGFTTVANG